MASIQFGNIITSASGKQGGVVFSHNRYGAYLRNLSIPVNPNSDRQSIARTRFGTLAARWNEQLTAAERAAWDVYAAAVSVKNRLGQDVYITGFNHYIRSNAAILACGGTIVDAAPATLLLPETDPTFSIEASEGTQLITTTFDDTMDWCDEDAGYMSIHVGIPKLTQVNFFGGPWRWGHSIDGDSVTPPTSPETGATPFVLTENQKLWCRARIIRADGRVSNFFRDSAVIGA